MHFPCISLFQRYIINCTVNCVILYHFNQFRCHVSHQLFFDTRFIYFLEFIRFFENSDKQGFEKLHISKCAITFYFLFLSFFSFYTKKKQDKGYPEC